MNAILIFPFRDGTIYQNVFQEYSSLFDNDISNFLTVMREIERRDNHSFLFIYYDKVRFVRIGFGEGVEMEWDGCEEEKREEGAFFFRKYL